MLAAGPSYTKPKSQSATRRCLSMRSHASPRVHCKCTCAVDEKLANYSAMHECKDQVPLCTDVLPL